jgi:hypothetical protein
MYYKTSTGILVACSRSYHLLSEGVLRQAGSQLKQQQGNDVAITLYAGADKCNPIGGGDNGLHVLCLLLYS